MWAGLQGPTRPLEPHLDGEGDELRVLLDELRNAHGVGHVLRVLLEVQRDAASEVRRGGTGHAGLSRAATDTCEQGHCSTAATTGAAAVANGSAAGRRCHSKPPAVRDATPSCTSPRSSRPRHSQSVQLNPTPPAGLAAEASPRAAHEVARRVLLNGVLVAARAGRPNPLLVLLGALGLHADLVRHKKGRVEAHAELRRAWNPVQSLVAASGRCCPARGACLPRCPCTLTRRPDATPAPRRTSKKPPQPGRLKPHRRQGAAAPGR
jgi:hypothetical protein